MRELKSLNAFERVCAEGADVRVPLLTAQRASSNPPRAFAKSNFTVHADESTIHTSVLGE